MRAATVFLLASAILGYQVGAQDRAGAQASSSANANASAQVDKSGAQASGSSAAAASAKSGQNSANLASGTAMHAALAKPVDARKNKPGDPVTAKTTESTKSDGQVVIPKGSKLMGHVTQAQARTSGQSESSLGVVFDRAILKNGQQVPLNAAVQAVAAAPTASTASAGEGEFVQAPGTAAGAMAGGRASAGAGGVLGGVRSTAGAATGTVTNTATNVGGAMGTAGGAVGSTTNVAGATRGTVGGLNAAGRLTSNSQGVFGLQGLSLTSAAAGTQGSLITSTSRNVHLDSGTQFLLVEQGEASRGARQQ
jgi:hypothetical protein